MRPYPALAAAGAGEPRGRRAGSGDRRKVARADEDVEAFQLEILSDFAISIPEIGTIRAERPPRVIPTSNRTREVRCSRSARGISSRSR
jgi:hypothetical protein